MPKFNVSESKQQKRTSLLHRFAGLYLRQARWTWNRLPLSLRNNPLGRTYGRHIDHIVRQYADRKQYFATFFLRNRPELELLRRLLEKKPASSRVNIAILACSKGAEVYSMAWAIRSARPDLKLKIYAIDISQEIVDFAERGIYSLNISDALDSLDHEAAQGKGDVRWNTSRDQNAWMFERMTAEEMNAMFEIHGNQAAVRPALREGIHWLCGDAGDPFLPATIGLQDIVVANRFLCHMKPNIAADCLRNIARLVEADGYLFVSGIDLDVRTRVARELNWKPVLELMREIHDGDDSIKRGWPLEYWGLEPFDDQRQDWQMRYATVFQLSGCASNATYELSNAVG